MALLNYYVINSLNGKYAIEVQFVQGDIIFQALRFWRRKCKSCRWLACGCVQERAAIFQRLHEKPSALISETRESEKSPERESEAVFPHSNLKINV